MRLTSCERVKLMKELNRKLSAAEKQAGDWIDKLPKGP